MCKAVTDAHADYIKTSTGFSKAGATFEDVELFKKHVGKDVKIKAAGGIASLDDAEKFLFVRALFQSLFRLKEFDVGGVVAVGEPDDRANAEVVPDVLFRALHE